MESEKLPEKQEEDGGECAAMETGGGRSQGERVMDNVKCNVREVGWGEQEGDGSKPEPSSSVFCMAWEAPTMDSNLGRDANWLAA